MKYILLIFIILFMICICNKEGYMNNAPPPDRPDDIQFYACHDYSNINHLGNNNYKVKYNQLGEPLQGAYSHFLNEYKLRNYDEYFHSPICEEHYLFTHISNVNTPTEIIDHTNIIDQDKLLKVEEDFDANSIKDPYYIYRNPNYVSNKLLYSKEINDLFIKNHRSHDKENLLHRLDLNLYNK